MSFAFFYRSAAFFQLHFKQQITILHILLQITE